MSFTKHRVVDVNLETGDVQSHAMSVLTDDEEWQKLLPEVVPGWKRLLIDEELATHGPDFLSKFRPRVEGGEFKEWEERPPLSFAFSPFSSIGETITATVVGEPGAICLLDMSSNILVAEEDVDENMKFTLDQNGQADVRLRLYVPGQYSATVICNGKSASQEGELRRVPFDV
jgi:hypothetical protein